MTSPHRQKKKNLRQTCHDLLMIFSSCRTKAGDAAFATILTLLALSCKHCSHMQRRPQDGFLPSLLLDILAASCILWSYQGSFHRHQWLKLRHIKAIQVPGSGDPSPVLWPVGSSPKRADQHTFLNAFTMASEVIWHAVRISINTIDIYRYLSIANTAVIGSFLKVCKFWAETVTLVAFSACFFATL